MFGKLHNSITPGFRQRRVDGCIYLCRMFSFQQSVTRTRKNQSMKSLIIFIPVGALHNPYSTEVIDRHKPATHTCRRYLVAIFNLMKNHLTVKILPQPCDIRLVFIKARKTETIQQNDVPSRRSFVNWPIQTL